MTSFGCKRSRHGSLTSMPEMNSLRKQESKLVWKVQKLREIIDAVSQSEGKEEKLLCSLQFSAEVENNPDATQQFSNLNMEWKLTLDERNGSSCVLLSLSLDKAVCNSELCSCVKGFLCQMSANISVVENTLRSFSIDKIRVLELQNNCQQSWGWTMFRLQEVDQLLDMDGSLTVNLHVTSIYRGGKIGAYASTLDETALQPRAKNTFDNNVTFFFGFDKLSDITITVIHEDAEANFKCHKDVLAAKSNFFRALLVDAAFRNNQAALVESELSVECMQLLLAFIYTGRLQENGKNGVEKWIELLPEIVRAAKKYKVSDLLEKCDQYLHPAATEKMQQNFTV